MKKPKQLPKIGVPVPYKGCWIVPVADGFDCVDRATGRWIHLPDSRRAKWNATVWTRLSDEFGGSSIKTFTVDQILEGESYVTENKVASRAQA